MNHLNGEPVRGVLHTTDASAVVAVPLFTMGGSTRPLAANEQLEITGVQIVSVAGGDLNLYCAKSSTSSTAAFTVARGTVAANGGIVSNFVAEGIVTNDQAGTPWFVAPAGVCDVIITGRIHQGSTTGRPTWQSGLTSGNINQAP